MTVTLYQGENAEKEWLEAISKYSWLRHPNLVQLYGVTSTPGLYAAILQDDLIPYHDFLDLYRHSPILTVYIHAYCETELRDADDYCQPAKYRCRLAIAQCGYVAQMAGSAQTSVFPAAYHFTELWTTYRAFV
ncbi:hypothetical protein C8R44DRAFT_795782, partial [Mycena epipterygia]